MLTFLAFLLTIAGSINWLLIGLLQYDYIAGFFGFQASIMSRIFYVLFGIGSVYLVLRVIINKGTFKIFERKKKKEEKEDKKEEKKQKELQPVLQAAATIEAAKELAPEHLIAKSNMDGLQAQTPQINTQAPQNNPQASQNSPQAPQNNSQAPRSVHFENLRDFRVTETPNTSENSFENTNTPQTPSNEPDGLFDEHMQEKL